MGLLRVVLAVAVANFAALARGQEAAERIETDRDSFTPATTTVARGRVVTEASYSFLDNRGTAETHSLPELLVRAGVADWLEVRLGANFEAGGESSGISGGVGGSDRLASGEVVTEANVLYGVKAWLTEQEGWMPRSSAILSGTTPTSGPETASRVIGAYVWGWELLAGWQWDSAVRYGSGALEEERFGMWAPSTVLKVELSERWTAHTEYFGIYSSGRDPARASSYFSPGAHYLVSPDLEVGLRVGWGLSDDAANFFSNVGLGWQY
jgi:hypothetical protein